jgi:hypothetical protein
MSKVSVSNLDKQINQSIYKIINGVEKKVSAASENLVSDKNKQKLIDHIQSLILQIEDFENSTLA